MRTGGTEHVGLVQDMRQARRTGREAFHRNGTQIGPRLVDFWSWADSELLSNALRGRLAEYLVAVSLGIADQVRSEWLAYDLVSPSGVKVEVKSAAYVQAWKQRRPSLISFGIAPTYGWDPDTGEFGKRKRRHADVYVFCLLGTKDQAEPDPLNIADWRFYVVPARRMDRRLGDQKNLTLPSLLRLSPAEVDFGGIGEAVEAATAGWKCPCGGRLVGAGGRDRGPV